MKSNISVTTNSNNIVLKEATPKQRTFLQRATEINRDTGYGFTYKNFPDYTKTNFRQTVLRLKEKGIVELFERSTMAAYKIKGIEMSSDKRIVTHEGMGVGIDVLPMLEILKEQPASIHDLKLKFTSNNLHQLLVESGEPTNPYNNGIKIAYSLTDNVKATIMVYPKTVNVDLSCSFKPFIYDLGGVIDLTIQIGRLYQFLRSWGDIRADLPESGNWVVTQYHFGKDGSQELADHKFVHTWKNVAGGLIRYYSKKWPDGKVRPRIEQIRSPNKSLNDEISNMIRRPE